MKWTEVIIEALTLEGIKNFFIVQHEDGSLDGSQIAGSIIQLIIFTALIVLIGLFFT